MIKYEPCSDIVFTTIDETVVIVDTKQSRSFFLEGSSAFIWKHIRDTGTSVSDLVQVVTEQYGIDSNEATKDILEFIQGCLKEGLIQQRSKEI